MHALPCSLLYRPCILHVCTFHVSFMPVTTSISTSPHIMLILIFPFVFFLSSFPNLPCSLPYAVLLPCLYIAVPLPLPLHHAHLHPSEVDSSSFHILVLIDLAYTNFFHHAISCLTRLHTCLPACFPAYLDIKRRVTRLSHPYPVPSVIRYPHLSSINPSFPSSTCPPRNTHHMLQSTPPSLDPRYFPHSIPALHMAT